MKYLATTCFVENFFFLLIESERWYLNRFREIGALLFGVHAVLLLSESTKGNKPAEKFAVKHFFYNEH